MPPSCARELSPLDVDAARGCHHCLGLLLQDQEPRPAELALERGWTSTQDPGWPRSALSFLTEDGTDGSNSSVSLGDVPEAGPHSSTRRSLLDEPEQGDRGVPVLWQGCPRVSLPPWLRGNPRGSTVPALPLASSTLLSAQDPLREPPPSILGGRMGGPSVGDIPGPCPQFAPRVSPRQHQCWILGGRAASPRSLLPRGGLSGCSVAPRAFGAIASDIAGAAAQPWGGAVPDTEVTEPGNGDPAGFGDSSSLGDSTECFVSALESLEPDGIGGSRPGAPPRGAAPSPPPRERPQGRDLGGRSGAGSDVGGLLARLGGCSLRGSPPCAPRCAGDATPRDRDPPGDRHVTPRSRSRLRAVAARLCLSSSFSSSSSASSSSSSSLFTETLPMPRRPPRLRVPRAAVTPPSGRCVTPRDGDVSGGEGTGSWGDTRIFPGLSPGVGSSPGSGPMVLLEPEDKGHPQNSSGSGSTVLLCPGDKGHSQNSSRSGATVLLGSGDQGHPQNSLSVTRGPPSATRMLEGDSGWQHPSPLGTSQSQWTHRSLRHLLATRPPGSARGDLGTLSVPLSPTGCANGDPGTLSVPLSPTGCATPHFEGHPEDEAQAPPKCHSLGGTDTTSNPEDGTGRGGCVSLSDKSLRRRLWALGNNPGPVTELTRPLYQRQLERLARGHWGWPEGHSPELVAALRTGHIPNCAQDELALAGHFEQPEHGRPWREGRLKSSFNYFLLDPRVTQNLPQRSPGLSPAELFRSFVTAVFYVGKGTQARPCWHLRQALAQHRNGTRRGGPKVQRILEIWAGGQGVVPLQCFHHCVPAEAYTRKSCMLEALGLQPLTNERRGPFYGVAAAWAPERRRRLGVLLLHRAMNVLLAEGERQLRPGDIPGGP